MRRRFANDPWAEHAIAWLLAATLSTLVLLWPVYARAQGTWQIPISVREQQTLKGLVAGSASVPYRAITAYGGSTGASAATNNAAFAAAIAATPAYGGIVYIPAGSGCYQISSAISVTKAVVFLGDGGGQIDAIGTSGSCVRLTSTTQNGFTVNTTEPVQFHNFSIVSTVASAGSGIELNSPGAVGGLSGTQKTRITNMQFHGLWKSVRSVSTLFAIIENSTFWDCASICIEWLNTQNDDQGDTIITGNSFLGSSTVYGIVWNSGGGFRVTNNKFLGFLAALSFDVVGSTQDFIISGNSIESFDTVGIQFLRTSGSASILYVQIFGNQISRLTSPGGGSCMTFGTTNATYVADIIITNNFCSDVSVGIAMGGGTRYRISDNEFLRITSGSARGIQVTNNATTVQICANRFTDVTTPVYDPGSLVQPCQFFNAGFTGKVTITNTVNSSDDLTLTNTQTNGASIKLVGSGGVTPAKFVRATAGNLDIMSDAFTPILTVGDTGIVKIVGSGRKVEFWDADLSNNVALIAPAVTASDVVLTLPGSIGVSGQCMKTDGAAPALLSFAACVTGTADRITISGTGGSVVDIAATYVGQASITTLGTITTGIWNAGAVTTSGVFSVGASAGLTTSYVVRCEAATDKVRTITVTGGIITDIGTCA